MSHEELPSPDNPAILPQENSGETKSIPLGRYNVKATFKNRQDEKTEVDLRYVDLDQGESIEDLKQRAYAQAAIAGLHNFGMNLDVDNYPDGHPVTITLTHETGQEIELVQKFNDRGAVLDTLPKP